MIGTIATPATGSASSPVIEVNEVTDSPPAALGELVQSVILRKGGTVTATLGICYFLASFLWARMPAFRKLIAFFGPPVPVTLNFFPRCLL